MQTIATVFRKQWADMRGRLWTYPLAAFTFALGAPDQALQWLGLAALVLALDLATTTAGDDARHGTFEFIFTRAVDRRSYLAAKYFFGVPFLLGFVALSALLLELNVRGAFHALISESLEGTVAGATASPGLLAVATAALMFFFSVCFFLISTAASASRFSTLNLASLIVLAAYGALVLVPLRSQLGQPASILASTGNPGFVLAAAVAFLAPAAGLYLAARALYARRKLPTGGGGRERQSPYLWVGLLLVALVALALLVYLLVGVSAPTLRPVE